MSNPEMFIIAHKKGELPEIAGYSPIQAGAILHEPLFDLVDSTGDNISAKNEKYCELTVQYWVWKNVKSESVGFVHYRRFFYKHPWSSAGCNILTVEQAASDLESADVILPEKLELSRSTQEEFNLYHNDKDLSLTRGVVATTGTHYLNAFDAVMGARAFSPYNMFIMPWDTFDAYMGWLFPVLEEVDSLVDMEGYDSYNKRLLGFISERLLNVWVRANDLEVKYRPVYQVGKNPLSAQVKNSIKRGINRVAHRGV